MPSLIKSPKDLWTGAIYVALGSAALVLGADYKFGTSAKMGPGYFPKVLAAILVGLGAISIVRSFIARGEPISAIAWKPLFFLTLGCVLFGVLLNPLGLIVALLVLCLVSAAGSREFGFDARAIAGLVVLITFCALVFVKGLGVPMPLIGGWLAPLFARWGF